ncbi:hypothetical protein PanWU01x14_216490 [Parasponia andersonii]|uniref:Uncharacterized protein n=1 Tax=Parasponia andersonii TaxID=3476 RepID=A0A2P5BRL8_PARAD|nr:hypothetical protein PanWU01x14_216490 [Parasponia andersonii]
MSLGIFPYIFGVNFLIQAITFLRSFSISVVKMSMLTAAGTTVVSSPLLLPARRVGCKRQSRLMKSGLGRVCYQFQPLPTKCAPVKSLKLGPVRFGTHSVLMETRKSAMFSTRRHSSAFICAAAFSATCAAVQTQTVTRQAPTITHLPAKDKLPDLDDGGTGLPPRYDGGWGGGGGGGGGNSSGGLLLFGFLLFLDFLKDKESE